MISSEQLPENIENIGNNHNCYYKDVYINNDHNCNGNDNNDDSNNNNNENDDNKKIKTLTITIIKILKKNILPLSLTFCTPVGRHE